MKMNDWKPYNVADRDAILIKVIEQMEMVARAMETKMWSQVDDGCMAVGKVNWSSLLTGFFLLLYIVKTTE